MHSRESSVDSRSGRGFPRTVGSALAGATENLEGGAVIMGVGVDITEFDRMRDAVDRQGQAFLDRIFTPAEQSYCRRRRDPIPCLASRFAAKEAVAKAFALGLGPMGLVNAEVCNQANGAPFLCFHGWLSTWLRDNPTVRVHLSLSDSEAHAVAVVVIESDPATALPKPPMFDA